MFRAQRRGHRRDKAVFVAADGNARHRRPLDRNRRARLMFLAEKMDLRSKKPGQHGGLLKRSGLALLKALLFHFFNVDSGRCDPSYDALAQASGLARSTVAVALRRLEAAGILERTPRLRWARAGDERVAVQAANLYRFNVPHGFRATAGDWSRPPESDNRAETTQTLRNQRASARERPPKPLDEGLRQALARLGRTAGFPLPDCLREPSGGA